MGYRRYLPRNHKWRNDKNSFDGTEDKRLPQKKHSDIEILHQVKDLEGVQLTKEPKKRIKILHDSRKIIGTRRVSFLNLHIGSLFCCDIIWMLCILRKIYGIKFWGQL